MTAHERNHSEVYPAMQAREESTMGQPGELVTCGTLEAEGMEVRTVLIRFVSNGPRPDMGRMHSVRARIEVVEAGTPGDLRQGANGIIVKTWWVDDES